MAATYNGKMFCSLAGTSLVTLPSSKYELDAGLTAEDVANGTRYNQSFVYAGAAKHTATVDAPWSAAAAALASLATASRILKLGTPNGGVTFPKAHTDKFKISSKINSYATIATDFVNESVATTGATAGAAPAAVHPPLMKDLTVTSAVGSTTKCQSFEVTYSNGLILVYTNSGDQYPSEVIYGGVMVSGTFALINASDAEMDIVNAACQSLAAMSFAFASVCASTALSLVVNNATYTKVARTGGKNAPTIDTVTWFAISPDAGVTLPLVIS